MPWQAGYFLRRACGKLHHTPRFLTHLPRPSQAREIKPLAGRTARPGRRRMHATLPPAYTNHSAGQVIYSAPTTGGPAAWTTTEVNAGDPVAHYTRGLHDLHRTGSQHRRRRLPPQTRQHPRPQHGSHHLDIHDITAARHAVPRHAKYRGTSQPRSEAAASPRRVAGPADVVDMMLTAQQ